MCDVEKVCEFQAVCDNVPTREGELSFKTGDVIRMVEMIAEEPDWANGEVNSKVGMFRLSQVVKRMLHDGAVQATDTTDSAAPTQPSASQSLADTFKVAVTADAAPAQSPNAPCTSIGAVAGAGHEAHAQTSDDSVVQRRVSKGPPPVVRPKTAVFPPPTAPKPSATRTQVTPPAEDANRAPPSESGASKKPAPPRPSVLPNRALYRPSGGSEDRSNDELESVAAKRDVLPERSKLESVLARGPPGAARVGVAVLPLGAPRSVAKPPLLESTNTGNKSSSSIAALASGVVEENTDAGGDASSRQSEWPLTHITKQRVAVRQAKKTRPTTESLRSQLAAPLASPTADSRDILDCDSSHAQRSLLSNNSPIRNGVGEKARAEETVAPPASTPSPTVPHNEFSALQAAYAAVLKRVEQLEKALATERDERKRLQDDLDWIRRMIERK